MKRLLPLIALLSLLSCRAQTTYKQLPLANDDNSLLWEISGKGLDQPSYLFGTMHMMCREDIRLSANLKEAIARSTELYFEMDLDDASNTLGAIFFMNMKNGKTLKDILSPEEYQRLDAYFTDSLKTNLAMLQKMKPMFLQAMIVPKLMPCKNMSGMEQEILKIAKEQKKEIKGFETIAFQASIFDSIPYDVQARELLKGLDSLAYYRTMLDSMIIAYKAQQLKPLEKMMNDEAFGMPDQTDILLNNRNKNWVEQLKKIMPSKNILAAVGAGHLPGEQGVINLLRKEGFTVRPIVNRD